LDGRTGWPVGRGRLGEVEGDVEPVGVVEAVLVVVALAEPVPEALDAAGAVLVALDVAEFEAVPEAAGAVTVTVLVAVAVTVFVAVTVTTDGRAVGRSDGSVDGRPAGRHWATSVS